MPEIPSTLKMQDGQAMLFLESDSFIAFDDSRREIQYQKNPPKRKDRAPKSVSCNKSLRSKALIMALYALIGPESAMTISSLTGSKIGREGS